MSQPTLTSASAEVVADVEREHLRWPARLAELEGLERTSRHRMLRHQLDQSLWLEGQLRKACSWHSAVAAKAVEVMWQILTREGLTGSRARTTAMERVCGDLRGEGTGQARNLGPAMSA
ncbi:hypothetical protein GCM10009733_021640 [Nonomuraea maheshkhaliensis]|uniref:DUF222 domain-containing protein n=1 Tax=Nonomuraea maheshkhaliensis TaxID=419590 RepID=A0ABP4QZZ0_9ACTN